MKKLCLSIIFLMPFHVFLAQNGTLQITNYNRSKSIFSKGYMENDKMQGKWFFYFKNGKTKSIEYYKDGIQDSLYVEFYENGICKSSGEFNSKCSYETKKKNILKDGKTTEITSSISCKVKAWKYYDKKGILRKEEIYDNGKIVSETLFEKHKPE